MMGFSQVARLVFLPILALVVGASTAYAQSPGCVFSFGATNGSPPQPTPTYTPSGPNGFPITLSITEVEGPVTDGCPWTVGGPFGIGILDLSISGSSNNGVGSSVHVGLDLPAAQQTAQTGTLTVTPTNPGEGAPVSLNITEEAYLQTTATAGHFTEPLTVSQSGTLVIPNIASGSTIPTVCSASNFSGLDAVGNNFFISCSAELSNGSPQLSITISSSTPALRTRASTVIFLGAVAMFFPTILLVRAGALEKTARERLSWRLIRTLALMPFGLSLFLLPSCGGGYKTSLIPPPPVSYVLTVMGYVTDASGNVTGVEVFTDFLNVEK